MPESSMPVSLTPVSHATAVLQWDGDVIYTDPVDDPRVFAGLPAPTLILVTDIHPDHLNAQTLQALLSGSDAVLIVPPAVAEQLPAALAARARVLRNGEGTTVGGLAVEAVPMYNLPDQEPIFHEKGRGNGYVLERDGFRVYIAGDTADTPEMRALKDIDIALVPMNLPFTMSVERAADGVLAFAPRHVYPYHYRGPQGGPSDIGRFKELVTRANPAIDVVLLDWYALPQAS